MSIRENEKKGKRGNLNLIFNNEDWSLAFVRIRPFKETGYLYPPKSLIPNDIIVDRPIPEDD